MGTKRSSSTGRRFSPASLGALAIMFALGVTVAALVGPALADISPPTTTIPTTTSGPSPDPAPTPTTKTKASAPKRAPAPAPKPQPTTSKSAPAPIHTSAPTSQPSPQSTYTPRVSRPVVHRAVEKTVKRVHHVKVKAKPTRHHRVTRQRRAVIKRQLKRHGVLGTQVTERATPVAGPVVTDPANSSNGLGNAPMILLFALPAFALAAALVPPRVVPFRAAIAWRDARVNVGLLAVSVLLIETLIYLLTS